MARTRTDPDGKPSSLYGPEFYRERHARTFASAERISAWVTTLVPGIRSVVDFGCGVGTWLRAFQLAGAAEILGLEGPWVRSQPLEIPPELVHFVDLATFPLLTRRYDLALCLEVCEHLTEDAAEGVIRKVCSAAEVVLFSAAVPGQPGTGHVNCHWQSYWAERFARQGFVANDVVRPRFWRDPEVLYFYQQNAILYTAEGRTEGLEALLSAPSWSTPPGVADLVHPELLESALERQQSTKAAWRLIRRSASQRVRKWLRGGR